jgi:hypothetical protein
MYDPTWRRILFDQLWRFGALALMVMDVRPLLKQLVIRGRGLKM